MRLPPIFVLASLLLLFPVVRAQTSDAQLQADVQHSLDSKRFAGIQVAVHDGNVVLTGRVALYGDKEDADRKAHHRKGVRAVENDVQVGAPGEAGVDDQVLRHKLAEALTYDRVGYGTTTFNNIEIGVEGGVVTLRGTVYGPADKDSAVSLVEHTPGVRDVIDELDVAPLSPNDDRIRLEEAQAIYGFASLQRYALNPAKSIRITVVNGHVTLNGIVDSKADKDTAGIRANAVPGVFSVQNNLQVAGQQPGR